MARSRKRNAEVEPVKFCFDQIPPTNEIAIEAANVAINENPANRHFTHFRLPVGVMSSNIAPALALLTGKKWANGRTLKVRFLAGAASLQSKVEAVAHQWSDHANITFDFGNHSDAVIRIGFTLGAGSWSALGTDALVQSWFPPNQPTMNYGWLTANSSDETIREVVLHEFGHALGCIHEHQHPEAGIQWDRQAVINELSGPPNNWTEGEIAFNVFNRYTASQTQFSAFDTSSIMGYYVPNRWTIGDFEMIPGSVLSPADIAFIGTAYPRGTAVRPLTVDGAPVAGSIGTSGEEDYYSFTVSSPGLHIIETLGGTDLIASLYGPNNPTSLIAEDDDSGPGLNPRIITSLTQGDYRIMLRHYNRNGTGDYRVRVRRGPWWWSFS